MSSQDTPPADPDVFTSDRHTIDITEDQLLGTHKFSDVLYTGDTDIVNVLTGETPEDLNTTVKEAKQFVKSTEREGKAPRVAKAVSREQAVESRSPYVSSAFFNRTITGGMDWHTVFRKAWESDAYKVSFTADYETGALTITVSTSDMK
jgi:hypothetical protein